MIKLALAVAFLVVFGLGLFFISVFAFEKLKKLFKEEKQEKEEK